MLLSSLAESVYWFGRYLERIESTARLILVNDGLLLDVPRQRDPGWTPLIDITGSAEKFFRHYRDGDESSVIRYLVTDADYNDGAMLNSIVQARENLRTTRALFPRPAWEVVNRLYDYVKENGATVLDRKQRYHFLREVIDFCHLLSGKLEVSMSHDEVYEFVRMGINIERADMTSRVIDVRAHKLLETCGTELQPFDDILWKSVLDSLSAWQMYRRCAHIRISGPAVLHFLLKDRHFPRAINHCLLMLEQSLYALAIEGAPRLGLQDTRRKVRNAPVPRLSGDRLHRFVDELQQELMAVHAELSGRYFEGREYPLTGAGTGSVIAPPEALPGCAAGGERASP